MASERYPRQREYPHPPPPSTNNTRTIINMVIMSSPSSPSRCCADWGPKPDWKRPKAETRLGAAGRQTTLRRPPGWRPHFSARLAQEQYGEPI